MTVCRFEMFYRDGTPPWVIGRAQPDLVALEAEGGIGGKVVLDAGCGSGDNAIYLAQHGYQVTGIDVSAVAIRLARRAARAAGVHVEFNVLSALKLSRLNKTFDTIIDYGLFHQFDGKDVTRYARSLAEVLKPEGQLIVQCFRGRNKARRFSPDLAQDPDLKRAFANGWNVEWIRPAKYYLNTGSPRPGWLASLRKH